MSDAADLKAKALARRKAEEDALIMVEWRILQGHEVVLEGDRAGDCTPECVQCAPYRTTPDEVYSSVYVILCLALDHPIRRESYETVYLINRTRLQLLAQHSLTVESRLVKLPKTKPVLVEVEMEVAHQGRVARAIVRGLRPMFEEEHAVQKALAQAQAEGETTCKKCGRDVNDPECTHVDWDDDEG